MKTTSRLKQLAGVLSATAFFLFPGMSSAFEIEIEVAPNVLNIGSHAAVVTVHTDIAYNAVDAAGVTLNGVLIDSWKADDRGCFVAKFISDEIKGLTGLAIGELNLLVLLGTTDGESFEGYQEIMVIDVAPKGR